MIVELAVRDLGVIAELSLLLGPGMTALTGETGAGKTLVVTAIDLLTGGRADAAVVRPGAAEARVDGRFVGTDGNEVVLSRVVPADGRSRAYIDGRPASVTEVAELGRALVDLHGQHAHQSLLTVAAQRAALDAHAGVDLGPLAQARGRVAAIDAELQLLGGDERARARELDLLRYQVGELDAAGLTDDEEDDALARAEALLAGATAAREAGAIAHEALAGDGGSLDRLGRAIAGLTAHPAYAELEERLRGLAADLADVAADLRTVAEATEEDPVRLDEVRGRRAMLRELRRKYGSTLAEVRAFHAEVADRLADLESHDVRAAALGERRLQEVAAVAAEADAVHRVRRSAAPKLANDVQRRLRVLAMPGASVEVEVGEEPPGDAIRFLLAANRGEGSQPIAKAASGGELARVMLALRLALVGGGRGHDGRTLVFDEVDAGIGGEAALAVGQALAELGAEAQVIVVTHLPQVAAFADHQVAVAKRATRGRTVAEANTLDDAARVIELSRMLSGQPDSAAARGHAEELLAVARSRA